jgi:small multidrug resistance family-3 protein
MVLRIGGSWVGLLEYLATPADSRHIRPMLRTLLVTLGLFVVTALAEIVGCYLPYLWLRRQGTPWLLLPAVASLALFSWLLTLHPAASGRIYASYGGVYVAVAILWLWRVDRAPITGWDLTGAAISIVGMGIIVWGGWRV